jgi:hypothetical protein
MGGGIENGAGSFIAQCQSPEGIAGKSAICAANPFGRWL